MNDPRSAPDDTISRCCEVTLREPAMREAIEEEQYRGVTILRRKHTKTHRRVLYLNSYGMAEAWRLYKNGVYPGHHLWGALELVKTGYEVAMPEPRKQSGRFFNYRRQDRRYIGFIRDWLGRDGIVYSAHTILFWTPLIASLNLIRNPVVTLLYARGENLRFAKGYAGVIALTPAAESRARTLAPTSKVIYLGWGADLSFYPILPYDPKWFLACGRTRRDSQTLAHATSLQPAKVRVVDPPVEGEIKWPPQATIFAGDRSQLEIIRMHYAGCSASLIILKGDSEERYGAGFSQLIEAMALARPIILTRTGALATEIDVEREECGLHVPPDDPVALANAMTIVAAEPARAQAMGLAGRRLAERTYNADRFGKELHEFFESL